MSRPLHLVRPVACVIALGLAAALASRADEAKPGPGTKELFNGKDLTGWGYKSGEKFDGKTESDDKPLLGQGRR